MDNQELWGGSLLGKALFDDPQKTLSLSQLLRYIYMVYCVFDDLLVYTNAICTCTIEALCSKVVVLDN